MNKEQLQELKEHLSQTVKDTVNGKIDTLLDDFATHKEEMKPILNAYTSASAFGRFTIWISKVMLAIGIIASSLVAWIKYIK